MLRITAFVGNIIINSKFNDKNISRVIIWNTNCLGQAQTSRQHAKTTLNTILDQCAGLSNIIVFICVYHKRNIR